MARQVDQSGLKVGDTVMYVGGRLPYNYGKRAKIVGIRDEYGFLLRYEDGTPGSATPEARKLVRQARSTLSASITTTMLAQHRVPANTSRRFARQE